jgi:two-component system KDP operon response regulator KdpE
LLAIRDQRFDLVWLDVNMPGMGGLAACREIRAGSDVAIIMLTVRNSKAEKVTALDAGADDYTPKPFGIPELSARIRAALRRLPVPLGTDREMIHLGEVEVDLLAWRVRRKGRETRLTPKEFELLQ